MAPLAILPNIISGPADDSDSIFDSGIDVSQASHETDEVTSKDPPESSTTDEGFDERTVCQSDSISERPESPQLNLLSCPDQPDRTRESSGTPFHYSNEFFEVKKSGLSGLGAFALQDLKDGQTILTEPVLLKTNMFRIFNEYERLTAAQQQAYNSLCSHCPNHATGLERIRSIYETNSFDIGNGLGGVYLVTARFNHACPPVKNVMYTFDNATITLKTTKDITAGTELTLTYATCGTTLYRNWGFICSCGGCIPLSQEELASINAPPEW